MTLSILIATTIDRRELFYSLHAELNRQIIQGGYKDKAHILSIEDNKEMSIGKKRQLLLEMSNSDWIVFFDSDDQPYEYYVLEIMEAITKHAEIDCIGMLIRMTTNGDKQQMCCHSLRYKIWDSNRDGYDYVRNITHFNPCKRELALQASFQDLRFGEDKDYSDRLTPLCKKEYFIDKPMFHYRYSNTMPHNQKYGI